MNPRTLSRSCPGSQMTGMLRRQCHSTAISLPCAPGRGVALVLLLFPFGTRDGSQINGFVVGKPTKGDWLPPRMSNVSMQLEYSHGVGSCVDSSGLSLLPHHTATPSGAI